VDQSLTKLKRALEDGYVIQRKRNAYRTPPIPKFEDPGYKSFADSMGEYYRQNHNPEDFTMWAIGLEELFSTQGLNFGRFKHIADSESDRGSDSYAKAFKRQLNELDKIVNTPEYFDTYVMLPAHPPIIFEEQKITQGYRFHKFNQSNKHTIPLLSLLWDSRQIETEDGNVLLMGEPVAIKKIYESLGITHDTFDLTVRAINTATFRKGIDLKVRYPKQQVQIVAIQDSM